jgi:hypothetical protein
MPLTSKGKKIMAAMVKQYGKQKGKEVFYASKNKGTIEGVEETKMNYIDRVNELLNEREVEVTRKGKREDSHTVYQHIGILMAEALGFVTENDSRIPRSERKTYARDRRGESTGVTPPPDPNAPTEKVPGTPFTTTRLTPEEKAKRREQSRRNAADRAERLRREKLARQGPPPASDALRR